MEKIKKYVLQNKLITLLCLLNALFLVYYLILAYYSRPHYDDLHFLWKLREMSIIDYVRDMYYSRSGRFVAYFINGIVFKTILLVGTHKFFPILFWSLGIILCWIPAKNIFKSVPVLLLFNVVCLFYNIYVLTNIDFAVFNWLCAMSYYILGPCLVYLLYLLSKEKKKWLDYVLLVVLSIFLGGGQEAFTPIVLFALLLYSFFLYSKKEFKICDLFKDNRFKSVLIFSAIMLVCFVIVIVAPGNYERMSEATELMHPHSLLGWVNAYIKALGVFYYFIAFYLPYYIVLAFFAVYIGSKFYRQRFIKSFSLRKSVFMISVIYGLYMIFSVFPSAYLWSGFGIQRNYTHVVFFTMLYICSLGFIYGSYKLAPNKERILKLSIEFCLVLLIVIMSVNIFQDTVSAKNYADSVDSRIKYLNALNEKGVEGEVEVEPLNVPYTNKTKYVFLKLLGKKKNPQTVLYYTSDTSTIPNEYAKHLKKVYDHNFLIKLKK